MKQKLQIYCKNLEEYISVEGGETLQSVANRIADRLSFQPICARVNNRNEHLSFEVYRPKLVEFLPVTHPSGERAYIRSLCIMLYRAVTRVLPGAKLSIDHSISRGYYCHLTGQGVECTAQVIESIKAEMRSLVERDLPIERVEDLTEKVIPIFEEQQLDDKVRLLRNSKELYTVYYKLDGLCDIFYSTLAVSTGQLKVWDLRQFKDGFLLVGIDRAKPEQTPEHIDQEKMYKAFTDYVAFNNIVGLSDVGELNQAIKEGHAANLVCVAEALHEKALTRISDEITRRYAEGGSRIVLISGPSSSGKTTTTKRLAVHLMTNLLHPQLISLDDYFIDREHTPRDESGDYDYESLYALDLELFNKDLNAILAGEEVEIPSYNFTTGQREYNGHKVKLGEGSILLIEGIHGLNPELTANIEDRMKFRLYVSALTTITIDSHNWVPTTDNRLLRRCIRDYQFRGTDPLDTFRRWPSVRRGEERWIFPYQENADAMFNSSLLYELAVVKNLATPALSRVPRDCEEFSEASRLLKFLSYFESIDLDCVPSNSLLREFLGGSIFKQ